MWKYLCLGTAMLVPLAAADHPNLTGTWQLDPAHSQIRESKLKSETLEIHQNEDEVAIAENANSGGKDQTLKYQCLADGSTCKAKDVSVMVYYNGPALVLLEMRHNNQIVIKKRIKVLEDGKTLSMDVTHVSPPGNKDETLTFVKQ